MEVHLTTATLLPLKAREVIEEPDQCLQFFSPVQVCFILNVVLILSIMNIHARLHYINKLITLIHRTEDSLVRSTNIGADTSFFHKQTE